MGVLYNPVTHEMFAGVKGQGATLNGNPIRCSREDDLNNANKYLQKAIELMPYDPIVNDHYGDILWKLNRKIQAKYYWESALKSKDVEENMKKKISIKLLKGLRKS